MFPFTEDKGGGTTLENQKPKARRNLAGPPERYYTGHCFSRKHSGSRRTLGLPGRQPVLLTSHTLTTTRNTEVLKHPWLEQVTESLRG